MIDWLRRLVMWDGILPLAVWATPRAAQWLLPGERWPIEVLGVTLPILAFIARFFAGMAVVRRQQPSAVFHAVKVVILFFGLCFLMIIDVAMILKLAMPKGAFEQPGDLIGFALLYGLYVAMMALATWPGTRSRPRHADDVSSTDDSVEEHLDEIGGDVDKRRSLDQASTDRLCGTCQRREARPQAAAPLPPQYRQNRWLRLTLHRPPAARASAGFSCFRTAVLEPLQPPGPR